MTFPFDYTNTLVTILVALVIFWMMWQSKRRHDDRQEDRRRKDLQRVVEEEERRLAEIEADEVRRLDQYRNSEERYQQELRDMVTAGMSSHLPTAEVVAALARLGRVSEEVESRARSGVTTTTHSSTSFRMTIDGEEVARGSASTEREAAEAIGRAAERHRRHRRGEAVKPEPEPEQPPRRSRYDVLSDD